MPKYYVTCLDRHTIVNAHNPLDACVNASDKMMMATAGISWVVSEKGFKQHEDDVIIPDDDIIREYLRRIMDKDKDK